MQNLNTRKEFTIPSSRKKVASPFRQIRRASNKIIFLSMEGTVTEEEYFRMLQNLYPNVASKIKFVSIQEGILSKPPKKRTSEEASSLGKSQPWQLFEKMKKFIDNNEDQYQFKEFSDDEFWIVMDVDLHWDNTIIAYDNKTNLQRWMDTIKNCKEAGYSYAVSNPFFENWLLLHHRDPVASDEQYAVTNEHPYEKTTYYEDQLAALNVPLKDKKHIKDKDYTQEKVEKAVERARFLHRNDSDFEPAYYATTVYLLVDKILRLNDAMANAT